MTKKTYKQKSDLFKDTGWRDRAEMAVREQALYFAQSEVREDKLLANGVIGNSWMDIEAVMATVVHSSHAEASIADDLALENAVKEAWAFVGPARYPESMITPEIRISSFEPPPGPPQLQDGFIENALPPGTDRSQEGIAPTQIQGGKP